MTLLHSLLRATAFQSPLLRTLVPSVALAYGIQAAVAVPSILAKTERYYDLSGSATYLSVVGASVLLPYLRARETGIVTSLGTYFSGGGGGGGGGWFWWWRQAALSAAVGVWAVRCTHLFHRITSHSGKDSRFDSIRTSPLKFSTAFFAQATWVTLCSLPVLLVNSLPRSAFLTSSRLFPTDILGLLLFTSGFVFEVLADAQKSAWTAAKKAKKHDEDFLSHGLWSKCRHPNYFGEVMLWSGIAVAAAGAVVREPAQVALGLSGLGIVGRVVVGGMCAASPAFVAFLLLKVSGVPLSEEKYDRLYGDREDYRKWKEETPMFVPRF